MLDGEHRSSPRHLPASLLHLATASTPRTPPRRAPKPLDTPIPPASLPRSPPPWPTQPPPFRRRNRAHRRQRAAPPCPEAPPLPPRPSHRATPRRRPPSVFTELVFNLLPARSPPPPCLLRLVSDLAVNSVATAVSLATSLSSPLSFLCTKRAHGVRPHAPPWSSSSTRLRPCHGHAT